jgi:hypothetical protein
LSISTIDPASFEASPWRRLSKTYDAFLAAGTDEDEAREAAAEIAVYENRLARIEADVARIKTQMATKTGGFAQTFVLLGGVAALIRLLH